MDLTFRAGISSAIDKSIGSPHVQYLCRLNSAANILFSFRVSAPFIARSLYLSSIYTINCGFSAKDWRKAFARSSILARSRSMERRLRSITAILGLRFFFGGSGMVSITVCLSMRTSDWEMGSASSGAKSSLNGRPLLRGVSSPPRRVIIYHRCLTSRRCSAVRSR